MINTHKCISVCIKMNVYGYARVSTRSQSYEAQIEQISLYCKMKGMDLVRVFSDKASGKDTDRIEFNEMLKTLESNPHNVQTVIVTKLDRVGRSIRDLLKFVDWCEQKKFGFVAISSNIDTTTKEGRLFFYIMGALSEYERELILERIEAGKKRFVDGGGKFGRHKKDINIEDATRSISSGVPVAKVARKMGVSRSTLYRKIAEEKQ